MALTQRTGPAPACYNRDLQGYGRQTQGRTHHLRRGGHEGNILTDGGEFIKC